AARSPSQPRLSTPGATLAESSSRHYRGAAGKSPVALALRHLRRTASRARRVLCGRCLRARDPHRDRARRRTRKLVRLTVARPWHGNQTGSCIPFATVPALWPIVSAPARWLSRNVGLYVQFCTRDSISEAASAADR